VDRFSFYAWRFNRRRHEIADVAAQIAAIAARRGTEAARGLWIRPRSGYDDSLEEVLMALARVLAGFSILIALATAQMTSAGGAACRPEPGRQS